MRRVAILVFVSCFANGVVTDKLSRGKPVSIEAVPFLASLVAPRGGALQHYCGASVVHEKFLVTAASCLIGRDVNETKVRVGTDKFNTQGHLYDVELLLPHQKYFAQTGDYNVALVKLRERLALGRRVGTLVLGGRVRAGSVVDVAGWGSNMNANASCTLHRAFIPVLRRRACERGLGRIVRARDLCAGRRGEGRGDCVSDEGGPVFQNSTLLGVATAQGGCGRAPGLYTRLAAVRGWVTDNIYNHLSYLDYFDEVLESGEEE